MPRKLKYTEEQLQLVIDEIRRLAAETPGCKYRPQLDSGAAYEQCFYTRLVAGNGKKGCGVGQAFRNTGLATDSVLRHWDYRRHLGKSSSIQKILHNDEDTALHRLSPNLRWLARFQGLQDGNSPWAECVAFADSGAAKDRENN